MYLKVRHLKTKMVKATHRSTVLSLLPFDPGEVQQELIATLTAANVIIR